MANRSRSICMTCSLCVAYHQGGVPMHSRACFCIMNGADAPCNILAACHNADLSNHQYHKSSSSCRCSILKPPNVPWNALQQQAHRYGASHLLYSAILHQISS